MARNWSSVRRPCTSMLSSTLLTTAPGSSLSDCTSQAAFLSWVLCMKALGSCAWCKTCLHNPAVHQASPGPTACQCCPFRHPAWAAAAYSNSGARSQCLRCSAWVAARAILHQPPKPPARCLAHGLPELLHVQHAVQVGVHRVEQVRQPLPPQLRLAFLFVLLACTCQTYGRLLPACDLSL